jgi:hypothetical protein
MSSNKPANKPASKLPWSVPVAMSGIPEGGKRFELVADEATRAEVAQIAGLRSLPRLQATFDVVRHGSDGLRVQGEVSATVGQTCVVTLDPIDTDVKEEVNLVFTPPSTPDRRNGRSRRAGYGIPDCRTRSLSPQTRRDIRATCCRGRFPASFRGARGAEKKSGRQGMMLQGPDVRPLCVLDPAGYRHRPVLGPGRHPGVSRR